MVVTENINNIKDINIVEGKKESKNEKLTKAELSAHLRKVETERDNMLKLLEELSLENKNGLDKIKITSDRVEVGLYKMDKYFKNHKIADNEKINLLEQCLSEELLEFCLRRKLLVKNWDEIKEELEKRYNKNIKVVEFYKMKQKDNEQVEDYIKKMEDYGN